MSDDPALDQIAAVIRATTSLVTNEPNLIGIDISDYRHVFRASGRAVFGEGEASGPDRARRAAEAAIADLKRKLAQR